MRALAGAVIGLWLLAACGYPDPTADRGPVATTQVTEPKPAAGSDDFNEGAGRTPIRYPDGLQVLDLKVGDGAAVVKGAKVSVQYTGWLQSGKKFDSSRDRGQPFEVTVGEGQVIAGWDEGMPGMKVGGRRKLTIPPQLGYGDQGSPPVIPGGATLVFTVELLAIVSPPSPTPAATPSPSPRR